MRLCHAELCVAIEAAWVLRAGTPVAGVFVCVSASGHRRPRQHPRGNKSSFKARVPNLSVVNSAIVRLVAEARGVWWVLEQPAAGWMRKQFVAVGLVADARA